MTMVLIYIRSLVLQLLVKKMKEVLQLAGFELVSITLTLYCLRTSLGWNYVEELFVYDIYALDCHSFTVSLLLLKVNEIHCLTVNHFLQLMCLADLEFDYINPYDSSSRINRVILPEFISQGVLCLFYLATGHWCMSLFCVPYLYYNVRL